jgi:hypothetical protein
MPGRVHNHIIGAATYPVSSDLLNSAAIGAIFSRNGTYLLPQAWRRAVVRYIRLILPRTVSTPVRPSH